MKQQTLSVTLTCIPCWIFSYLATNVFQDYAFGLFVWLPIVLGVASTLIYSYKNTVSRKRLRNNAYLTLLIFCLGLLFFAWEGIICLAMAAPIGFVSTYMGFFIAENLREYISTRQKNTTLIILFLSVPSLMAFEKNTSPSDDLRSIVTQIEINASPEKVWQNVVSFPELKPPTEFIFKTGIAYPTNATISGEGVGAVRSCNFSTGCFIEPITIWDKPNQLKFSVKEQPVPMQEISFYKINPSHLHGYWVSKQGQFKLKRMPNGHTLLEGTTWYTNKIKPAFYWTLWSDYIVHKIHNRVLNHIKEQAEIK